MTRQIELYGDIPVAINYYDDEIVISYDAYASIVSRYKSALRLNSIEIDGKEYVPLEDAIQKTRQLKKFDDKENVIKFLRKFEKANLPKITPLDRLLSELQKINKEISILKEKRDEIKMEIELYLEEIKKEMDYYE